MGRPLPLVAAEGQPGTFPAIKAQDRRRGGLLQKQSVESHLAFTIGDQEGQQPSRRTIDRHAGCRVEHDAVLPWWDIPLLIALGLFAGGLAGLLGIGGGLIFAPLLLWLDLPPHQALATSSFAIVPTALSGTVTHLHNGSIPQRSGLAIGLAAFGSAMLFGGLAGLVAGWILLAMQTLMYLVLAFAVRVRPEQEEADVDLESKAPLLAGVGCIAGWSAGMLGLGGGLVMVPLMNGPMAMPIHAAVRLSTVAVFCSATAASLQFLHEGRGVPWMGLLLGGVAALAARWTASRLDQFDAVLLVRLLRGLAIVLALDSSRRAIQLVIG